MLLSILIYFLLNIELNSEEIYEVCPDHFPDHFIRARKDPKKELEISGIFHRIKPEYHYKKEDNLADFYFDFKFEYRRREYLSKVIGNYSTLNEINYRENLKLLIVVTKGYLFMFLNWLCSVEQYGLNKISILQNLFVITVDDEATLILNNMGFNVINGKKYYLPPTLNYHKRISSNLPVKFGYNGVYVQKAVALAVASDML
jgi:hypothetical protein